MLGYRHEQRTLKSQRDRKRPVEVVLDGGDEVGDLAAAAVALDGRGVGVAPRPTEASRPDVGAVDDRLHGGTISRQRRRSTVLRRKHHQVRPWARYVREVERWASPYLEVQAAYFRDLATTPVAEVLVRDGVYCVATGIASNVENGVISDGDVATSRETAKEALGWLSGRVPASWLCAEGRHRAQTARVLEALGCRADTDSWEMRAALPGLDLDRDVVVADVRIERVTVTADLEAWLDVARACAWFETEVERSAWRRLHQASALDQPWSRLHVAYSGDRAVGIASSFQKGHTVLLSTVAVIPTARRRGIGRALAYTRLRDARANGATIAVLAPSPDGAKLYQALGFTTHRQPAHRWFYLPLTV